MPSGSAEARLFNPDPAVYLPHRYPFLLLDRIHELERGVQAVARTAVTINRRFSQILLVECVAQLAGIVVAPEQGEGEFEGKGEGGFLASIDHAEFSGLPAVGDVLSISAKVLKSFGRLFLIEGNVVIGTDKLLAVQLTLGVGKI